MAREADAAFIAEAGAELRTRLEGDRLDAVIDAANIGAPLLDAIVDHGAYVGVLPFDLPDRVRGISVQAGPAQADGPLLQTLIDAAANGTLTPRVRATMPLAEDLLAQDEVQRGGVRRRSCSHRRAVRAHMDTPGGSRACPPRPLPIARSPPRMIEASCEYCRLREVLPGSWPPRSAGARQRPTSVHGVDVDGSDLPIGGAGEESKSDPYECDEDDHGSRCCHEATLIDQRLA